MTNVYLALYKGRAKNWRERLVDWLIRKATKGKYSHCEIAVKKSQIKDHYHREEWYECYSSSPRDGGVRCKVIDVSDLSKWDLIPLTNVPEAQIKAFYHNTKGKKYDLSGALGIAFGSKQMRDKYFCSEWCWEALYNTDGWRFSPNHLPPIILSKELK